jgi:D-arginine dehydrogenase
MSGPLPARTRWAIIGAGFAGAATAWALGRHGLGPGVILEQELSFGVHASGRNAALFKVSETDPIVSVLGRRSLDRVRRLEATPGEFIRPTGGFTVAGREAADEIESLHRALEHDGLSSRLVSAERARSEFPFLRSVNFITALFCKDDGVADIHALLGRYLERAREAGFTLHVNTRVDDLLVEAGRVSGVRTEQGNEIRADIVIDASGAWAGRLGRTSAPLPLTPLRRHLFVSAPMDFVNHDLPFVWVEDAAFYFRPEGDGLLLSPCDETAMAPGLPPTDPAAAEMLADKLSRAAPAWADLAIRRSWACLRTFASDRRPLIGPDPEIPGLFHVSGLGGFGMTCSGGIGELAAELLAGLSVDWIDTAAVAPARLRRG